ncbi:MAG: UDP-N-acetylmuramate--L-alanine ligase [Arthrospira sp. PLM2.Bin9]|nr:UDP-N-acetylmuramate--L-alanine ligase [Arthrospira sp. PLM2.Bin9]TVU53290.1 MAG: UDP-N-acetylmuramate--L-alanine ligase [Arthrospira sp. PLM2.Bin9]
MPNTVDFNGRPFHFIGIGGIGMSALAHILAERNLPVFGSDLQNSHITERLQAMGAHIFGSQDASNFDIFKTLKHNWQSMASVASGNISSEKAPLPIESSISSAELGQQLPQVICSTAIHPENAEYKVALELGCPIFHRSDLLAALIAEYQSIAVAGTHGKTTTSSLMAFMLLKAGLDPTILVGGEVSAWEGNARVGHGPYLVAEADESDGSLVKLGAYIGVVTNIELDHPDHYKNLDQLISTFKIFANQCETIVGCVDCPIVRDYLKPTISYSINPELDADYTVDAVQYLADGVIAQVYERGEAIGLLKLQLLGSHNLSNALAAVAVGRLLNLEFSVIAQAIAEFPGTKRRFEYRGNYGGIQFVDDYAHHPSEIRVTLAAARGRLQNSSGLSSTFSETAITPIHPGSEIKRVVAIFQPHRYSRTETLLEDFAQCFGDADLVMLTEIYSAGEANPGRINGQQLAARIAENHPHVDYQPSLDAVKTRLFQLLKPGDLVLFLGAGNLNRVIPEVMAFFQSDDNSGIHPTVGV